MTTIKAIIVREEGTGEYKKSKLQSAMIELYEITAGDDFEETLLEKISELKAKSEKFRSRIYFVGTSDFRNKARNVCSNCGVKLNYNISFQTESRVIEAEHLKFPEEAKQASKAPAGKSKIRKIIDEMKCEDISDSDIAGVYMAAEELDTMKVFPATEDNVYKAFLRVTEQYIPDSDRAKKAVDYYLSRLAEKSFNL